MLGRNKTSVNGATRVGEATPTPVAPERPARPGAKNRPTPKRKDQEAARRRPLVETDRKAAKEADKRRAREARMAQRAAADRGDDSALPLRDRGPEKRYIRDRIDSRFNLGEIAMPLMMVLIFTWFITPKIATISLLVAWTVIFAGVVEAFFMWRSVKKGLIAKFGHAPKGSAPYAIMRAMQMRRARYPKVLVKRGDKVA